MTQLKYETQFAHTNVQTLHPILFSHMREVLGIGAVVPLLWVPAYLVIWKAGGPGNGAGSGALSSSKVCALSD